jgi:hypothetical protein
MDRHLVVKIDHSSVADLHNSGLLIVVRTLNQCILFDNLFGQTYSDVP